MFKAALFSALLLMVPSSTSVPTAQEPSDSTASTCTKQNAFIKNVHAFCRYYRTGQVTRMYCVNKDGTEMDIIVDLNQA